MERLVVLDNQQGLHPLQKRAARPPWEVGRVVGMHAMVSIYTSLVVV